MLMHCKCGLAAEPIDRDWCSFVSRHCLLTDVTSTDGAVEVWRCRFCDAHRITIMRKGVRTDFLKGGVIQLRRDFNRGIEHTKNIVICKCGYNCWDFGGCR